MKPASHFASLLSNKFIINSRGNELEEFVRMVQADANIQWTPISEYKNNRPCIFYYPPITDEPHPSNNKDEVFTTELWHNRKPSYFKSLKRPL